MRGVDTAPLLYTDSTLFQVADCALMASYCLMKAFRERLPVKTETLLFGVVVANLRVYGGSQVCERTIDVAFNFGAKLS